MFWVICFFFVVSVLALGVRLLGFRNSGAEYKTLASVVVACIVGLTLVLTLFGSIAIVGTKEVGIVTAFNRPVDTLDNGIHFKAPWQDVSEMDGAIQTDNHTQDGKSCVDARIAHQIVACVDVTVRWRIREGAADTLFRDYRDFDNVRSSLVARELATDVNAAFSEYDPLAVDAAGNATGTPLNDLSGAVLKSMQSQIGGQVEVLSVFIPVMHFDDATQSRLNALQSQVAQTRIATQAVKTAEQQAQANQALAVSVSNDSNVLVSKCLDVLSEMVTKGQSVPAGFTCWPGGSSLVIPATK